MSAPLGKSPSLTVTSGPRPWIDFDNPEPTRDMDNDRQEYEPKRPPLGMSETDTFTVHWAQLPPSATTSKAVLRSGPEPSLVRSSSTPTSVSMDLATVSPTQKSGSLSSGHEAGADVVGESGTVSSDISTSSAVLNQISTSVPTQSLTASTTTGSSPSIGASRSSDPLSGGATAAIVVSSFLAFSLCGFFGWLRWRQIKKRRTAVAELDFSTLRPYHEDAVPTTDVDVQSTPQPLALGWHPPFTPSREYNFGSFSSQPDTTLTRSFTRPSGRGDGFRVGDPTIVELPG